MCLIYKEAYISDYFPSDALVILDQPGKCSERAAAFLKQASEDIRLLIEGGTLLGREAAFYTSWEKTTEKLLDHPVIMADSFTIGKYPMEPKTMAAVTAKQLPSYAGSSDAAADDVRHWLGEGYRCVLLASDKRRSEALEKILREKGITDIYPDPHLRELPAPGKCAVSIGSLSAGMEYPQIKLAVITDSQIMRTGLRASRRKRALPAGARIGSYEDLSVGDLVVHETHGIGRFAGIFKLPGFFPQILHNLAHLFHSFRVALIEIRSLPHFYEVHVLRVAAPEVMHQLPDIVVSFILTINVDQELFQSKENLVLHIKEAIFMDCLPIPY